MKHLYLTVLSQKAVACQVKGIASCLRPSAVALTLTLNAAECLKLSFAAVAGDHFVFQDGIQLPCRPLETTLGPGLGGMPSSRPWYAMLFVTYFLRHRLMILPMITKIKKKKAIISITPDINGIYHTVSPMIWCDKCL